jgi:hypothetical protein
VLAGGEKACIRKFCTRITSSISSEKHMMGRKQSIWQRYNALSFFLSFRCVTCFDTTWAMWSNKEQDLQGLRPVTTCQRPALHLWIILHAEVLLYCCLSYLKRNYMILHGLYPLLCKILFIKELNQHSFRQPAEYLCSKVLEASNSLIQIQKNHTII